MSIEITLTGNGTWDGTSGDLVSYSVDEESTPLAGGDTAGAISSLRFVVATNDDTPLLYDTGFMLSDGSNGATAGTIRTLTINEHTADISGESVLGPLIPERQIQPRQGDLATVVRSYFTDNGITTPVAFDPELNASTTNVAMQGWYGSPWEYLKMMCVTFQFEISVVSNIVVIRKPRKRISQTDTDSTRTLNIDRGEVAKTIEVVKYKNQYKANAIVYPAGGWSEELEIYSVDADEVVEVEIPVDVSILSIEQPTAVQFVARNYTGPSVYAIAGNDGLPIMPDQWRDHGGKVEVSIGEDTKTIILKITGPSLTQYAPYTLSVNSGQSDGYSSLRLRGTGVHFTKDVLGFPTGADSRWATAEVGTTVDNPTIQTDQQVAQIALTTADRYSAPRAVLTASALVTNRSGEPGFVQYMTFQDFENARQGTYTFQSFETEFAGMTFGQIQAKLEADSVPADRYENQAFGNVVGSRVRYGDAWYRVRRATITESGVSYEAETDTTFGDIETNYNGMTFAQIATQREGMTFAEIALMPLRKTA